MHEDELRRALEHLQVELLQIEPQNEEQQAKLNALISWTAERLEQPALGQDQVVLGDVLEESLLSLDVTHPKLGQLLRQVASALSSIGI